MYERSLYFLLQLWVAWPLNSTQNYFKEIIQKTGMYHTVESGKSVGNLTDSIMYVSTIPKR